MTPEERNSLPEAPASVTYSVTSKDGYNALFTVRGTSGTELLETLEGIEKTLFNKGYKPQIRTSGFPPKTKEYAKDEKGNDKICPKCGGKLIVAKKADGKEFHKCENNKWDPILKKATGCDHVDWLESDADKAQKQMMKGVLPDKSFNDY